MVGHVDSRRKPCTRSADSKFKGAATMRFGVSSTTPPLLKRPGLRPRSRGDSARRRRSHHGPRVGANHRHRGRGCVRWPGPRLRISLGMMRGRSPSFASASPSSVTPSSKPHGPTSPRFAAGRFRRPSTPTRLTARGPSSRRLRRRRDSASARRRLGNRAGCAARARPVDLSRGEVVRAGRRGRARGCSARQRTGLLTRGPLAHRLCDAGADAVAIHVRITQAPFLPGASKTAMTAQGRRCRAPRKCARSFFTRGGDARAHSFVESQRWRWHWTGYVGSSDGRHGRWPAEELLMSNERHGPR